MTREIEGGTFTLSDGSSVEYRVRVSNRAHRIRFVVDIRNGLTVVVPSHGSHSDIEQLLSRQRTWIEDTLAKTEESRRVYAASRAQGLPDSIDLFALQERWRVEYRPTKASSVSARPLEMPVDVEGVLRLSGAVDDEEAVFHALRSFVTRRVKDVLPALVEAESTSLGVTPHGLRFTNAKTRWGSCSAKKVIMFSSRLAFLPPILALHVIDHELAHLVHFNHSAAFHQLLCRIDPNATECARLLREAGRYVPAWMDSEGR